MSETNTLTNKTMARLRALVKGNGLPPEKIELIESIEKTYALTATVRLEPDVNVKVRKSFGRQKPKNGTLLPSLTALNEAIEKERQETKQKTDWLDAAIKELENIPGHGWGQDGATLVWDKAVRTLAAHDPCQTCHGTGQCPCPECQGLGTVICTYCDGQGNEHCVLCQGRGEDPHHNGQPCPQCRGTRVTTCRFCQPVTGLPGRMPCPRCAMKGSLACPQCQGTGFVSQEVEIKKCAILAFKLGPTTDLPSGLLRAVQKIGDDNLPKNVPVTMARTNPDAGEDPLLVKLSAAIPYADMKVRFDGKAKLIGVFGEKGRPLGVPPFLDDALREARMLLAKAVKGLVPLEKVLETRAMTDALGLILAGKTHPNEMRRIYPVGLSETAAKGIMGNMALAVRNETRKIRALVGAAFLVLSGVIFAGFFLTSLFETITASLDPNVVQGLLIALPVIALAKGWFILSRAGQWALRRRFNKDVSAHQPIGNVGYAVLGGTLALYGGILYLAGLIPL